MSGLFDALASILGLIAESEAGQMIFGLSFASFVFAGFYRLTATDGD